MTHEVQLNKLIGTKSGLAQKCFDIREYRLPIGLFIQVDRKNYKGFVETQYFHQFIQ
jgi:hypothetical protein